MIALREVSRTNFDACVELERHSERFVGNAAYVLAEAYVHRRDSTAYVVCADNEAVGLVILRDRPDEGRAYAFTSLFIADPHQGKGFGRAAVEAIIRKCRAERLSDRIEIFVHESNEKALRVYRNAGFVDTGRAAWDGVFLGLRYRLE